MTDEFPLVCYVVGFLAGCAGAFASMWAVRLYDRRNVYRGAEALTKAASDARW